MPSAPPTARRWLTAILIVGASLRFFPIWFGLTYQYSRPDETEAVGHARGILGGDLNPHFFHWPSLTFYLFAAVFAVVSGIRNLLLDDPVLTRDVAVLTGRLIVAAAGTLTIIPVYRLARRVCDPRAALPTLIAVLVIGAPSFVSSAWMDVLLARTDSRIVAGQWLRGQLRPEHSVYDAGWTYVRLDLRGADCHQWLYDPRTHSFGDPDGRTPHWLVITESPLRLYAQAEPSLQRLAAERYTPVLVVRGTRSLDSAAVYDRQDAFFMAFSRFWEVERPGPTITIYRRRD